jgi:hypothetical protein
MKYALLIVSGLLFASCASTPPPTVRSEPARYATPEESARLQSEARAKFERQRQQEGGLLAIGSGPAGTRVEAPRSAPPQAVVARPAHHPWSLVEARYALQIGKTPAELTPGERAAAHSE